MRFKNPKPVSLEFCFCLIVAIILLWPFFVKAQSVTLNTPATSCVGSSGQVNLTWSSDVTNPNYYILRRLVGEATSTIAGPISDNFFTDNNIVSDKAYFYKIRAERGNNVYFSNEVQVSALYCPAVLSMPVASCQTDGPRMSLNWSSVSGNLSRYEVYRNGVQISQTSNTNFDDGPNLEGTINYTYFIKTIWQDGHTEDSQTAQIQALACPPILTINSSDCATDAPGGPRVSLSWNNLLGVQNYQIYRKAQSEINFSLLTTSAGTSYTDNLVESLSTYVQGGQVSYYVKAIWQAADSDSAIGQTNISRCAPYLTVDSICNSSALLNPEMHLSWTATQGSNLYNIYRDDSFYIQITNPSVTDFIDYLDPLPSGDCPNKICTHSYKVEASVAGFPNFPSNQVAKDIDCTTVIPPSPAPVLDPASAYCVSGDSRISLSWTASDNVVYYTLYRNGISIINLLETNYKDSGIQSGQIYTYQVTAFGRAGTRTGSPNTQTLAAVDCTPPSISTLTVMPACENGRPVVNLSWTQTSNTEVYEIWRGLSATNLSFLMTFNKLAPEYTSRTWKDATVSPSIQYYYRVVSKGPTGVPPTNSVNTPVTTSSCLPTAPTLTITPACQSGNAVMNLSWTDGGANAAYYEIFRQDYMGGTTPYQTILNPRTTIWTDSGVVPNTNYTYKIDAIGFLGNRVGQGWRPASRALNCAPPGPFTLSEPNAYCQGSYVKSELSWTQSLNATSYELLENRFNSDNSIAQTITLPDVSSPYTDRGFGNALNFDDNDFVNIGNPSIPLTGNLTIEFWAKPTEITYGRQNPLCKYYANEFCLTMETNGSLSYYHGNNSSYTSFGTANVFTNNVWVHVVLTRDLATRTMRSYKNGVFITSATWSSVYDPVATANYALRIGRGYVNDFRGIIDDVRLYNRVLSASEIQEHYQVIYNNESNLIGLWHFDEGSGQTVSDSSNYVNNGTLGSTSSVGTDDPAWIQNGPQSQTKYSWQAKAIGPGGSTYSNTTSPNTMPLCQPTKPGLILNSFCNAGNNLPNVTLRWSYTTATVKYEIYRDGILIKTINQGDSEFSSRTWTDTNSGAGLTEQTSYTYYVKAIGQTGLENQSDSISNTTPSCLVSPAPQNLTAAFACGSTGNSYPRVNLSWSTTTNTTYYTVFRSTAGGPYTALTPPPTTPYFTDTNVNVNTNYFYYVTAYGPGGASLPSAPASTTTGYCMPSTPSISSIATVCESNSPANTISWSDSTTFNTFSYEIYRNSSTTIPGTPIKTIASTSPEFTLRTWKDNSGLSALTNYYYWVRAVGPAGQRTSSLRNITTLPCGVVPSAPNLNLDNAFCDNNVPRATLSWNNVSNAYSYNLYRTNPDASQSVYSTRISSLTDKGSSALSFDGSDDYLNISNSASLNPAQITMEAWIYPTAFVYYGNIINKRSPEQYFLRLYSNTGRVQGYIYSGGSWRSCTTPSTIVAPLNQWSHIVQTFDGSVGRVYINGVQGCTYSYVGEIAGGTNSLKIGTYYTSITTDERFKGLIDEARIYGRALSVTEVSEHYNGIYKNEADLRGVWHFDEGTGNTAYDQSGNNNNGTLYNGPIWQTNSPGVLKVLPLENFKTYKYKVKAFGADTESTFSNEISFAAPDCAPVKPDLTVTSQCPTGNTELFLNWSDDPNTLYWSIYKKRGTEPYSFLTDISRPQTDFADSNVESGTAYEYFLIAVGSGTSTISDAVPETASFCAPPPSKPVISATSTCYGYNSRMKIEWQPDPTNNTISYNIWRKNTTLLEPDFTKIFSDLPGTATQYLDIVAEANNYIYKVEAVGSGTGNSVFSDPSNEITSLECSKLPPFPSNLYLNLVYSVDHRVAVSIGWTDSGNADNYKVFRRLEGESQFAKNQQPWWKNIFNKILGDTLLAAYEYPLVTLASSTLNYVDYTVTDGQIYEYQVMASNANGDTLSNILRVVVPIARPGEFELSGIRLPNYRVYLTWTEALTSVAGGQVTYDILRSNASDFASSITICSGVKDPDPIDGIFKCFDNDPPLLLTIYYRAIATNIGGITESNIVRVGLPVPIWKEIMP